ncbi:MAG: hypothetical protein ACLFR7_00155 [Opitutales bacterium]
MSRLLRQLFFGLRNRERLLLFTLFAALLLLWATVLLRELRTGWTEYRDWRTIFAEQSETIERAPAVDAELAAALSTLDSGRTYSASQLVGKLDSVARDIGLSVDLDASVTEGAGIYTAHNVRLRINDGNLADIMRFNEAVQTEAPYIAITQFRLAANRRDPRLIDATFDIASFELQENLSQ